MEQAMRAEMDTDMHEAPVESLTVCGAFQRVCELHPDRIALRTLGCDDALTWAELGTAVRSVAGGLAALGVGPGDTVAMMLPNVPECHTVDIAAIHLAAVPFTIYNSSSPEQIEYQLGDAASRVVVTQQAFLAKVLAAKVNLPELEHVVVIDGDASEDTMTFAALREGSSPDFDFDATWRAVDPEDLVTLIYTSGTTGPPKGAQWAHRSVMSQLRALGAVMPLPQESIISFLPMAHAGGRIAAHYMALPHGATITCCPDLTQLPQALGTAHPDAIFTVPRVWEKLKVGIEAMVQALPEEARAQAQLAIADGSARARAGEAPGPIPDVLRPILERIGLHRLRVAFVGGAPSAPELSEFFRGTGVPLLEAYGSTECGLNIFNRIEEFRGGTVGKPLPGVELKLAEDGELLVRAKLNMVSYRNLAEQTADTIDAEDWLHTGDIAAFDEDGFVKIVDRKKEIIISAAGKNMSPANIESTMKGETSLIGQVATIGDGRRYITALIVLDPEAAAGYANQHGIEAQDFASISAHPQVRTEIEAAVARGNERLSRVEQIKKFTLLGAPWPPDSDEMTPTMKLKRKSIAAKYEQEIEALYAE